MKRKLTVTVIDGQGHEHTYGDVALIVTGAHFGDDQSVTITMNDGRTVEHLRGDWEKVEVGP
jgi:hypothetical protein